MAFVVGVISYFAINRPSGTVAYHLARYNELKKEFRMAPRDPSRLGDYFRMRTLLWYLKGKPSLVADWEQEQKALLDLGYFERREVVITNRELGADAWRDRTLSNAFFGGSNSWTVHLDDQRRSWVRVTGTNLDAFEKIVRRWDSQQAK